MQNSKIEKLKRGNSKTVETLEENIENSRNDTG